MGFRWGRITDPVKLSKSARCSTESRRSVSRSRSFRFASRFSQLTSKRYAPRGLPWGKEYGRSVVEASIKRRVLLLPGEVIAPTQDTHGGMRTLRSWMPCGAIGFSALQQASERWERTPWPRVEATRSRCCLPASARYGRFGRSPRSRRASLSHRSTRADYGARIGSGPV